jgi:hypothetical protein
MCDSQDLTLQAILSNGVATVRQTLWRMFSAMAAERAKKGRKLVLRLDFDNHGVKYWRLLRVSSHAWKLASRSNSDFRNVPHVRANQRSITWNGWSAGNGVE